MNTIPGIDSQRLAIYRELFFNNVKDTLDNAFPVISRVLNNDRWLELCRDFFAQHRCSTPFLSRLPGEFVSFLQHSTTEHQPAWLLELAQWEWNELDLFLQEDIEVDVTGSNPVNEVPVLTPHLRLHDCKHPVHHIKEHFTPANSEHACYHLLAWRKQDHSVGFLLLNDFNRLLIQLLLENSTLCGLELLHLISDNTPQMDREQIIQGGIQILNQLYSNKIIVGSRLPEPSGALA